MTTKGPEPLRTRATDVVRTKSNAAFLVRKPETIDGSLRLPPPIGMSPRHRCDIGRSSPPLQRSQVTCDNTCASPTRTPRVHSACSTLHPTRLQRHGAITKSAIPTPNGSRGLGQSRYDRTPLKEQAMMKICKQCGHRRKKTAGGKIYCGCGMR